MTNLTEIPIQRDSDGLEYINVSDSNFIAGQKTTSAGESLYSLRVYIWNQGFGFSKKYSYSKIPIIQDYYEGAKRQFYNYTNWVDGKHDAKARMEMWKGILEREGVEVDASNPYPWKERKERRDKGKEGKTNS